MEFTADVGSTTMSQIDFENLFDTYMQKVYDANPDPSHDILHVRRVVQLAKFLAHEEKANLQIVIPAAYLHDCVYIAKTDKRRTKAYLGSLQLELETRPTKRKDYPSE